MIATDPVTTKSLGVYKPAPDLLHLVCRYVSICNIVQCVISNNPYANEHETGESKGGSNSNSFHNISHNNVRYEY